MLMADQQFKLGFAVRAVILVQWHRKLPPIDGKRFIIIDIVLRSSNIVKSEILISKHNSRSAEGEALCWEREGVPRFLFLFAAAGGKSRMDVSEIKQPTN